MDNYGSFSFLEELEDKYPVDQWVINDIEIWPLIRIRLSIFLYEKSHINLDNNINVLYNYSERFIKIIHDKINVLAKDRKYQPKLSRADFVFMRDMADRNIIMTNGKFYDHNMDPLQYILESYGYSVFNFEQIGKSDLRLPRWSRSYIIDILMLRAFIDNKIYNNIDNCFYKLEKYDEFLNDLSICGIDKYDFSIHKISNEVLFIKQLSNNYKKMLKVIKPKTVVYNCWYSRGRMALSLAAHRLNIPVVEIQHGVAAGSNSHSAYFKWSKIPNEGYSIMPDYMWVWDKDDYKEMIPWANNSMRPFVGGHPMNLIWSDQSNELSQYYKREYENLFGFNKPTILVTLQWGNIYPQWFVNYINEHDDLNWLIRLHPLVDDCQKIFMSKLLNKDNIYKDSPAKFPLEILLQNVNLHCTLSSSVVLDAEVFNCHSIIMNEDGINKYSKQLDCKMASFANNKNDFHAIVRKYLTIDTCGKMKNNDELRAIGNYAIRKLTNIARTICQTRENSR